MMKSISSYQRPPIHVGNKCISNAFLLCFLAACYLPGTLHAQAPSSILPDLEYFKITYPLDANGNDYTGVSYANRSNPAILSYEIPNDDPAVSDLTGYVPSATYSPYFYVSGSEVVFKAHCAGALTSVNAYPRCELRERILKSGSSGTGANDYDGWWDFSDEHELNATFRITHLPDIKQEVCVLQIKGQVGSSSEEAFRMEYRQDGSSGIHLTINEANGPSDIMDYTLGDRIMARMYVNNDSITIELNNLDVSGARGEYYMKYKSDYDEGYFKAGCYTQSSIWAEKNNAGNEDPDAYGEVRFSALTLGTSQSGCVATAPGNRAVNPAETSATFTWNAVSQSDHYLLRYRPVGGAWITSAPIVGATSYVAMGLTIGETYEWQVASVCADGSASDFATGAGSNFTTAPSGYGACVQGSNVAPGKVIALFSSEQNSDNGVANLIDGLHDTRWSAETFPQFAVIDLGAIYSVEQLNLVPHKQRDYQFLIEGSTTSATADFFTMVDSTDNVSEDSILTATFAARNVRYVKLTVTGATAYTGAWCSIEELEVICAGNAVSNDDELGRPAFVYYPNPFSEDGLRIQIPTDSRERNSTVAVMDMLGRVIEEKRNVQPGEELLLLQQQEAGLYLIRWTDETGRLIQTEQVVRQ